MRTCLCRAPFAVTTTDAPYCAYAISIPPATTVPATAFCRCTFFMTYFGSSLVLRGSHTPCYHATASRIHRARHTSPFWTLPLRSCPRTQHTLSAVLPRFVVAFLPTLYLPVAYAHHRAVSSCCALCGLPAHAVHIRTTTTMNNIPTGSTFMVLTSFCHRTAYAIFRGSRNRLRCIPCSSLHLPAAPYRLLLWYSYFGSSPTIPTALY